MYFDAISHTPPSLSPVFSPQTKDALMRAIGECIELSPAGDCYVEQSNTRRRLSDDGYPMGEWDVSAIRDMSSLFDGRSSFNTDISKWYMSRVTDMSSMFKGATSFGGDISGWDVSQAVNMANMFREAESFDIDISEWDVSRAINMDYMFQGATSFTQRLCDTAWIESKASKTGIFTNSAGWICSVTTASTSSTPTSTATSTTFPTSTRSPTTGYLQLSTAPATTNTAMLPTVAQALKASIGNTDSVVGLAVMGCIAVISVAL